MKRKDLVKNSPHILGSLAFNSLMDQKEKLSFDLCMLFKAYNVEAKEDLPNTEAFLCACRIENTISRLLVLADELSAWLDKIEEMDLDL